MSALSLTALPAQLPAHSAANGTAAPGSDSHTQPLPRTGRRAGRPVTNPSPRASFDDATRIGALATASPATAREHSSAGVASLPTSNLLIRAISSVTAVASPASYASTTSPTSTSSNSPSQPLPLPATSPHPATTLSSHEADGIAELVHLLSSTAQLPQRTGKATTTVASAQSLSHSMLVTSSPDSLLSLEEGRLDAFLSRYARCYSFPHPNFHSLFSALLSHRLLAPSFDASTTRQHRLRILRTLRVLTRDSGIQKLLMSTKPPLARLLSIFRSLVPAYFASDPLYCSEMLVEVASICKRLAEHGSWQRRLLSGGVAELCVRLLSAREAGVLQSVLLTLINLSASSAFLDEMLKLPCIEPLLALIQERTQSASQPVVTRSNQSLPPPSLTHSSLSAILSSPAAQPYPAFTFSSAPTAATAAGSLGGGGAADVGLRYQCLAGELLDLMCINADCRYELRMQSANRIFVNLLLSSSSTHDEAMLMPLLRCIASMALDEDGSREIRYLGGIPLLLQLLNTREGREAELEVGAQIVMAVCAALTQLANDDENAYQICRHNGILTLTHLFLLPFFSPSGLSPETQPHTLRVLRYLYSTERNRKPFKRLFPSEVFTLFVDRVGHWKEELRSYEEVVAAVGAMGARVRDDMWSALVEMRAAAHSKQSNRRIVKGHILQEVLGKGAFGTVYRVMKEGGERVYAMKEIPLKLIASKTGAAVNGGEMREVELRAHVDELCAEVSILSQLNHPNIVRYYSSFVDSGCMYIVMELVEGTSLLDHITSQTDRGGTMSEEQIWPVFIQLCLALSYMHIDKRVVHRDLTSNNIMIDPRRRAKVMDLGLALQRREREEVMNKPAGTIAFSCPEIVTGDAYTDKADIWSLGCILYQMATGKAPFGSENPIAVTRRVVSGQYTPVDSSYSPLLHEVVRRLLTVDPKQRPDILQVSFLISPLLMAQLDRVNQNALRLEQELHHEQEARKQERDEWMREKQMWRKVMANRNGNTHNSNNSTAAHQSGSLFSTATTAPSSITASASSSLSGSQSLVSLPVVQSEEVAPTEPHSGSSTTSTDSPTPLLPASTSHSRNQSLLVISPTKLRPLSNPLDSILQQVHKLVYISQLPPRMQKDKRRVLVNKYKTALFRSGEGGGSALKREMQAVLLMNEEWIDAKFDVQMAEDSQAGLGIGLTAAVDSGRRDDVVKRVTHEDMHLLMEQILREEGYYQPDEHGNNDLLSSGSSGISNGSVGGGVELKEGEWRMEVRTDSGADSDENSAAGNGYREPSDLKLKSRRLHESRVREVDSGEAEANNGRDRHRPSSSTSSGSTTPHIRRVREKGHERARGSSSHHSQSDKVSDAVVDERRRAKEERAEERPATAEPHPLAHRTPRERASSRDDNRRMADTKHSSSTNSSAAASKVNSANTSNTASLTSSPTLPSSRKLSTSNNGHGGIAAQPATLSAAIPSPVSRSPHSVPSHAVPASAASSPLVAPIKQSVYPAPHPAPFTSPPSSERRPQAARNLFTQHKRHTAPTP